MKKVLSSIVAIASLLMLGTSCSSEEVAPVTGESTVTLSVTLPDGIQSRAFGDGTTADSLTMLVLDGETALPVFTGTDPTVLSTDINLTKQVTVRLAAGKTYKVVCWASAKKSPYTFDTVTRTVSANYEDALTGDEKLDAFYAAQDITVTGNTTETVKLYRPFAQLNIGTNDLVAAKAAGFDAKTVKVTVPTYKSLNLVTGAVEQGDPVAVPFGEGALPTGEAFPKTGYDYLAMNYLLMSADKQLVDLEFTVKAADGSTRTIPVTAVPIQRNYRTNIYGSLLTNSVNINVEIVPAFEESAYEVAYVATAEDLVAALNAGSSVVLEKNLVVSSEMHIVIPEGKTVTLNLNGKTISNTEDIWSEAKKEYQMLNVDGAGTLVLTGKGKLDAKENDCYCINVRGGAHLIIENGTYVGNVSAIQVDEGVCEIKGGTFDLKQLWKGDYTYMLNCIDANYKNGKAKFIVTGGTFTGFNPAYNGAEGEGTNFLADGYIAAESVKNGKQIFTVKKAETVTSADVLDDLCYNKKGAVIYINTPIVNETGSAAYCYNGGTRTITLDKNGSLTSGKGCTLTVASGVTVNLNGLGGTINSPVTTESYNAALKVGGNTAATLNIYGNGNYIQPAGAKSGHALLIAAGTANIYGGYFYAGKGTGTGVKAMASTIHLWGLQGMSTCNIYGGVFECEGDAKYLLNCEDSYYKKGRCKFVVYGGIFVGFDPAESYSEGTTAINWVADGYKSVKTTYNGKEAYQVVKK